jgi:hypothetical protein
MSISNSAVLAELNISVWTANKLDKGATETVLANNMAGKDSAQVRKNLMAGTDKRKKIADFAARARLYHNQTTLPWADKGARVLPTSLFMDYKQSMNMLEGSFNNMVASFLENYDDLIELSQQHLGSLFDASDYPSKDEVQNKFGFKLVFSPLPESGDFRLDIPNADIQELATQYESAFNDRLADAMREPWEKLHRLLAHMSEKLTASDDEDKKRYHDSFITNAQELCGMLTHLNITKDAKLEQARRALELTLLGVDIDDVREFSTARASLKSSVDAILNKFDW